MNDQRKEQRFTVILNAKLMNTMVDIVDISKEGMQIKSKVDIKPSENINFYIFYDDLDGIKFTGDIMWKEQISNSEHRLGIKYQINSIKDKKVLQSFLEDLNNEILDKS